MNQIVSGRLIQLFDSLSEGGLRRFGVRPRRGGSAFFENVSQGGTVRTVPQAANFGLPHRLLGAG
jgi:hypothetical protein